MGWVACVSVTLERADEQRIEGRVRRVAATGAFVVIDGMHVPTDRVLAVHLPSLLGDSDWDGTGAFHGTRRADPQREQLWESV